MCCTVMEKETTGVAGGVGTVKDFLGQEKRFCGQRARRSMDIWGEQYRFLLTQPYFSKWGNRPSEERNPWTYDEYKDSQAVS